MSGYYAYPPTGTCYSTCPTGYFANGPICSPCQTECISCDFALTCTKCKQGSAIDGVCIDINGCTSATKDPITNNPLCLSCSADLHFVVSNYTCVCMSGYSYISQMCINIPGCTSAITKSNVTVCFICRSLYKFVLSNGTCVCTDGYFL
jgi:hypothetical protein